MKTMTIFFVMLLTLSMSAKAQVLSGQDIMNMAMGQLNNMTFDFSNILSQPQSQQMAPPTQGSHSLLYEGSFTTSGGKFDVKTKQVVSLPTMSVYARIYTDKIEVTAGNNFVVKPYWKFENGTYYFGVDNDFWTYKVDSSYGRTFFSISEVTPSSIIVLARTCPTCNATKYCTVCRGAGLVIGYNGRQQLCGSCGGSKLCGTCNGSGTY